MEITASQSTKIRIAMILLFGLFMLRSFAQTTIKASSIMQDIREGKDVKYTNVTIAGDLDFTYMDEKMPDLPEKAKWWNNGSSNSVEESIDVRISFTNCVFEDDVLAYIHDDPTGYTFVADFDRDVIFKDCEFNKNAMFKYSDFDGVADFSNSTFERKSTFKYAEFDQTANFSGTRFDNDATFKYAQFDGGASFKNAIFEESWNIKYMKARGDFDIAGLDVKDEIDAKYTKINGRSFTNYLIETRN